MTRELAIVRPGRPPNSSTKAITAVSVCCEAGIWQNNGPKGDPPKTLLGPCATCSRKALSRSECCCVLGAIVAKTEFMPGWVVSSPPVLASFFCALASRACCRICALLLATCSGAPLLRKSRTISVSKADRRPRRFGAAVSPSICLTLGSTPWGPGCWA